jgi:aconitate hydratase
VIAYALAGTLAIDPTKDELTADDGSTYRLEAPAPAPDIPERGFVFKADGYMAPPADRSSVSVQVADDSKRLQLLEPFPAWDGNDYIELPILLKAVGKCTTDHISQAGPWLRFRGHLDNISDNLYLGADNEFAEANGHGEDIETGEVMTLPALARAYKQRGIRWAVVGDENFGEGSSREHAAMEPRHMGGLVILVRSFARIHETNLKKQGMLPLTFADAADYDKVRAGDRLSVLGLADLAPGQPLTVALKHTDGTEDRFQANHSLNADQVEWFKAGSALNVLRRS